MNFISPYSEEMDLGGSGIGKKKSRFFNSILRFMSHQQALLIKTSQLSACSLHNEDQNNPDCQREVNQFKHHCF